MTTEATESTTETRVPPRLKTRYRDEILPALAQRDAPLLLEVAVAP